MDTTGSDKFALEAFSLAFAIQRIFQSRLISQEAKEKLFHDYRSLKEQVSLLDRLKENRERDQKTFNKE